MMRYLKYAALALVLAVPAALWAQPGAPAQPGDVAARVGDRVITLKEVDEAWRRADSVEHTRATQMLYTGRKEMLDRMIADLLIEQTAKAKGVTPEQFVKDDAAKRVKPVSDAEITAFYDANKSRVQGKPFEDVRVAIRQFLEQQQQTQAREALVAELKKAGPAIQVAIEPPRQKVDVAAADPARGGAAAPVVIVEFSDYQ